MADYDVELSSQTGDEGEEKTRPQDYKSEREICQRWKREIEFAERSEEYKEWLERCGTIRQRYKNEKDGEIHRDHRYAILWSNVQTMRPALYSRTPVPFIRRRYKDNDAVARVAAEVLERANKYTLDEDEGFDSTIQDAVDDYLLFGKGWTWNRYEFEEQGGKIVHQKVITEHVPCDEILHNPAKGPKGIRWIARKNYMRRDQLEKFFKDVDKKVLKEIPLDHKLSGGNKDGGDEGEGDGKSDAFGRACIYEIWDKESKQVYWISKSYPDLIEQRDPPLDLQDFFPCPNPLIATRSGSMNPTPDYIQYQDQALELDELTTRIYYLTRAIKVNFGYDQACVELGQLLNDTVENQGIPVKNWPQFQRTGGFKGTMDFLPIDATAQVLEYCLKARGEVLNTIYAITGIADIIRGNSNPTETATAQQIKGRFATLRLSERQLSVQRFVRDNLRIRSEIIGELFEPGTLRAMVNFETLPESDQPIYKDAIELLKNEPIRCYRIEIETDSTVAVDEDVDRRERAAFTQSLGQFFQAGLPLVQSYPAFGRFMSAVLLFTARGMKVGRTLEGELQEALEEFTEQSKQPPPQPPDPKVVAQQQQLALKQQEFQLKVKEMQADFQLEVQKLQSDRQLKEREVQIEVQKLAAEHQKNLQKIQMDYQAKLQKMEKDAEAKVQVAIIQAMAAQNAAQVENAKKDAETARESVSKDAREPVNFVVNMPTPGKQVARFETLADGSRQAVLEPMSSGEDVR